MMRTIEADWLKLLEPAVDQYWDELSAFEQKFIENILARFKKYGSRTFVSTKEWGVIALISEKVL